MNEIKKPELLIPAGSLESLKVAFRYGADAVYVGGEVFSLRAKAKNFSVKDLKTGIDYAHAIEKKVYITLNIFAHNADIQEIKDYLNELKKLSPDGLIISDPGVYQLATEICPEIERHISTQANNTNYATCEFWHKQGAKRIVLARELSLDEIKEIKKNISKDMEIEVFIHGSMCMSYSGRCLLSNFFTGRDANKGECTHPCRWNYAVVEEKRPGEYFPVIEEEKGSYIFNSKDLCMIDYIPGLIEAGIDSFKIEGRMKNSLYVATVSRTYRRAIDDYFTGIQTYKNNLEWYRDQIADCTFREFSTGFFFGAPGDKGQIYGNSTYKREAVYLGVIQRIDDRGCFVIEQKNKFSAGEEIEIMKPNGDNIKTTVKAIYSDTGEMMESAPHSKQIIHVLTKENGEVGDVVRKIIKHQNQGTGE